MTLLEEIVLQSASQSHLRGEDVDACICTVRSHYEIANAVDLIHRRVSCDVFFLVDLF